MQELWSGYGFILRITTTGNAPASIIVKLISPDANLNHPRGWDGETSDIRKLRSYEVEQNWYRIYAGICTDRVRIPNLIWAGVVDSRQVIILEDLDAAGYSARPDNVGLAETKVCLEWLAKFHGCFISTDPKELWPVGTYWHLSTRQDEFRAMDNSLLKRSAHALDRLLNECPIQTIVHGDAKLANFCFTQDRKNVAAVDFQYVGGGCGMKDVIYLLGSCLSADQLHTHIQELLDHYFAALVPIVASNHPATATNIEQVWRPLFGIAWTDFNRFLAGWMPNHAKINDFSLHLQNRTLDKLELYE